MILFFGGMILMRKIITNNKPTRFDGHLVYTCQECSTEAYVSLPEALTEGFIVVCAECNAVLKLKPIKEIRVDFVEEEKPAPTVKTPAPPPPVPKPVVQSEGTGDNRTEQPAKPVQKPDLTKPDGMLKLEVAKIDKETMIPDHFYDNIPEKFDRTEPSDFVIQDIPDDLMPTLESVVGTLKKYGYGHDEAAKLTYGMCRTDVNRKWTTKDLVSEILKQEKEVIIHVK